jgi:hypothetical protein
LRWFLAGILIGKGGGGSGLALFFFGFLVGRNRPAL